MDELRRFLGDYALSVSLAVLFLVSWLLQSIGGWVMFVAEQAQHNETATLFGESGYIWNWMESTFENWQSEFLQLFTFVVLSAFLLHRHSHESRDDMDELKKEVEQVLAELKERNK